MSTEVGVYKLLQGKYGIPKLYWHGSEGDYNIMVIDLLGQSVEDLFQACGKQFTTATTFALAQQMVFCVSFMNSLG